MSATNRGTTRAESDFYATPASAFLPLLDYLPKDSVYWEPACGDCRIIDWLTESGRQADGSDLHYSDKLGPRPAIDFLLDEFHRDFIITNPPFSLAQPFCDHALRHGREVMMLLRLNFLGAQKRREWWRQNQPSAIFVLSERPDFTGKGGDACDYGWFYWGRRFRGFIFL